MESTHISVHQVRLYEFLKYNTGWCTSIEAALASRVAKRTARLHLLNWVKAGILDQADTFPGHRYRLSGLAENRNRALIERLTNARNVLRQASAS